MSPYSNMKPNMLDGVQLRYNYRLYPAPAQRSALARAFGCARVVFNDGLRARQEAHRAGRPYLTDAELSARLTAAKKTSERQWLGEVSAVVLQQALADLNAAYRNFFASLKGERKSQRVGPPRLRSRKDRRQAIRLTANARFTVLPGGRLRLPKIGDVAVRWSRPLPGQPSSVTVIRDAAGRYFASFVVQTDPAADARRFPPAGREVGIDLGLAAFAVLSDGTKISAPRFLRRAEKKLRRLQRAHSRTQKGSRNREKSRAALARAHATVADRRADFCHQASTMIIRENQAVYVENLCVAGLGQTGWPNRCTTPGGPPSRPCWSTRPPGTAAPSPGPAGSSPPARCAQPAEPETAPNHSASVAGRAPRAGPSTTGTLTRPATYSPWDAGRA